MQHAHAHDAPTVPFLKMNGLGNDFVVFDARAKPLRVGADAARQLADRDHGIGCDQVIIMEPSARADAFMRIINADGSEVSACGNATRCVAAVLASETGRATTTIETRAGLLSAVVQADGTVSVDMGQPKFSWQDIPLSEAFADTRGIELQVGPVNAPILHTPSVVNVGNPHCIFWVDDVNRFDLGAIGPMLEHHPLFPERCNISLAQITTSAAMILRVWERGAGLTRACGTAACAAAVAAARKGLTGRNVVVTLPGGPLTIAWRADHHIIMTGPVTYEFREAIDAASFGLELG